MGSEQQQREVEHRNVLPALRQGDDSLITMAFWESTFYFGIAVTVFLVVSPFIVHLASKNEKNRLHRVLYALIAVITDCGLIGWFLIHIHSHGLTLPQLLKCYVDYFRNNPH